MKQKRKDFEIKFYEELIQERPDFTQVLASLGDAYTRKGFYAEGLAVDRKLVRLKPDDPLVRYNLACSLSLTGALEAALDELKRAVLLGYEELDYILRDPDLASLRKTSGFVLFWRKISRS